MLGDIVNIMTDSVTYDMDLDEEHELLFRVQVEGASGPARTRLVCERNGIGFMFSGKLTDEKDVVQFVVPAMNGRLDEGNYKARVEVLVDNRCLSPLEFELRFKRRVFVTAESISMPTVIKRSVDAGTAKVSLVEVKSTQTLKERHVERMKKRSV
jgi:hypothetical protein